MPRSPIRRAASAPRCRGRRAHQHDPERGGNRFSGSAFAGGTNGSWQSNNVTDELKAKGLVSGDRVDHISDYNYAIGGPIMQDRLHLPTFRRIATNEVVANNFYEDGVRGSRISGFTTSCCA